MNMQANIRTDTTHQQKYMTQRNINSFEQQEVAAALSDIMLNQIAADDVLGGKALADKLTKLRDTAWFGSEDENKFDDMLRQSRSKNKLGNSSSNSSNIDTHAFQKMKEAKQERKAEYEALLDGLDAHQTKLFVEGYAKLGHLFEIAGQVARENFFKRNGASGGISELLNKDFKNLDATQAIEALNKPEFIPVLTQHPTNVNSLESIKAMRNLDIAAGEVTDGKLNSALKLNKAMQDFLHTSLIQETDGKPSNFTVHDETRMVEYFLNNLVESVPELYQKFDAALTKKYGDEYHPEKLNLKTSIASWGSAGDKDGNNNVKSENTLQAIAIHYKAAVDHYIQELEKLSQTESLKPWLEAFQNASPRIAEVIQELEKARAGDNDIPLTNEQFQTLSEKLNAALKDNHLDAATFEENVLSAYQQEEGADKQQLLNILRQTRMFHLHLADIEYREKASEYSRVIGTLLGDDYETLTDAQKTSKLTDLITNHPEKLQQAVEAFLQNHDGQNLRAYDKENADAITYHTIRRMELARDFNDMIHDHVLAECQNTSSVLEVVALQLAVAGQGKPRAHLGVIPLFEESDTLQDAPEMVKKLLENPAYKQHMRELYEDKPLEQQIQIAHSDNARRSGVVGARGFIHAAHKKIREVLGDAKIDGNKVNIVMYQGGSQSDAYRNGVRSISGMTNAFDLHKKAKMTFQGGDLTNYFNYPSSITRLLERQTVHSAKALAGFGKLRTEPDVLEDFVTLALQNTLPDYVNDHFNEVSNPIGRLFAHPDTDYNREVTAQNVGSRAPKRDTETSEIPPALESIPTPINTEEMRTISFSEFFSSAIGIVASWLGGETLCDHFKHAVEAFELKKGGAVYKELTSKYPELFTKESFNAATKSFKPAGYKKLYEKSPAFKDTIDKLAYSILNTDMQMISSLLEQKDKPTTDPELMTYCHKLMNDYCAVSSLVYQALEGREYQHGNGEERKDATYDDCERARFSVKHAEKLHHLQVIDPKQRYREFASILRNNDHFNEPAALAIRRLSHSATDTVYHGRTPEADDITYGLALNNLRLQAGGRAM